MPKYKNPRLTEWKTRGTMSFMKYQEFKALWATIKGDKNKHLLTFLYFTGARPGELPLVKRSDIVLEGKKLIVNIPTLKRKGDQKVRAIELPLDIAEVKAWWGYIQTLPDLFYIFGWLAPPVEARHYIKNHLGVPGYFFRHNIFSIMSMAGASRELIKEMKGAQNMASVEPYIHLSAQERAKMSRYIRKGIRG